MKQNTGGSKIRAWFVFGCWLCAALAGCEGDDGTLPKSSLDAPVVADGQDVSAGADAGAADAGATDASLLGDGPNADVAVVDARPDTMSLGDAGGDTAPLPGACDIYDPQSCSGATKCDLARDPATDIRYTACRAAGMGKTGDACTGGSQCRRGLICINSGGGSTCRQVCDLTDGDPGCTAPSQTCVGRSANYGVTFCL